MCLVIKWNFIKKEAITDKKDSKIDIITSVIKIISSKIETNSSQNNIKITNK